MGSKFVADFGTITTVAGTGTPSYDGDGGPADKAGVNNPFFCAFDRDGNLYFADTGNGVVRRVEQLDRSDQVGRISTIVGRAEPQPKQATPPGQKPPENRVAIAVTQEGDIYLVERLSRMVRRWEKKTGKLSVVAGTGTAGYHGDGGPGPQAQMKEPHDCALDGKGGLFLCDVADCRVRRLDLKTHILTTYAGTGVRRHEGDGGPATAASLAGSRALAVNPKTGDVYICEREGNRVRKVDARTGIITPFAGSGQKGYTGDGGPASAATFNGPKGLACDPDGNLFVVDTENHAIRKVDARTGILSTVAGGHRGSEGDGGPATAAGLNRPHGVCVGPDGSLYIADSENNRVRRVAWR
jgi:streptogramin lyase